MPGMLRNFIAWLRRYRTLAWLGEVLSKLADIEQLSPGTVTGGVGAIVTAIWSRLENLSWPIVAVLALAAWASIRMVLAHPKIQSADQSPLNPPVEPMPSNKFNWLVVALALLLAALLYLVPRMNNQDSRIVFLGKPIATDDEMKQQSISDRSVLLGHFHDRMRIDADKNGTHYLADIRNKRFNNCNIVGPVVIESKGPNNRFINSRFMYASGFEPPPMDAFFLEVNKPTGMFGGIIGCIDCAFYDCVMVGVTIAAPKEEIEEIVEGAVRLSSPK